MKIVGLNHQFLVNAALIVAIVTVALVLKEPLALLGLFIVQPTPVNMVPTSLDEMEDAVSEGNEIGFHADI